MKDTFIKTIQKFLNEPFKYAALLVFLDRQKDFLLKKDVLEGTDENEYNALWDTISDLEAFFAYAKGDHLTINVQMSVKKVFEYNLKCRTK